MSDANSVLRRLPRQRNGQMFDVRTLLEEAFALPAWKTPKGPEPFDVLLTLVHKYIRVQSLSLLIHDGTTEQLVLSAATDLAQSQRPLERYSSLAGISGHALDASQTILVNDIPGDGRASRRWVEWWSDRLRPHSLRHGVFIPLTGDLELRCVLRFFNRLIPDGNLSPFGFQQDDQEILNLIARVISVQINRIWLADRLGILNESIHALLVEASPNDVAHKVARTGARLANVAAAAVFFPDPSNHSLLSVEGCFGFRQDFAGRLSVPVDRSLVGRAARTGVLVEVEDLPSASDASPLGPGAREGMVSLIAIPLAPSRSAMSQKGDDRSVLPPGVLVVYSKERRAFQPSTRDLLQQFALSAGSVLDSRRRARESDDLRKTLAIAAHSVRSPLQRLASAVATIRSKDDADNNYKEEIGTVFRNLALANARLGTMLHSRKGIIEITGLELTQVNLAHLIGDCVDRHTPIAIRNGRRFRLRENLKRLSPIVGDHAKLDLVFDNLIENAVKYSWNNEVIDISGESAGDYVRVSITDRGLGVPIELQDKIFDSFIRSDILDRQRHIQGTGLGLYVVRMIVEAHGGTVRVKSIPFLDDRERRRALEGFETTFTVNLPVRR